jgi:hypothetical protein
MVAYGRPSMIKKFSLGCVKRKKGDFDYYLREIGFIGRVIMWIATQMILVI